MPCWRIALACVLEQGATDTTDGHPVQGIERIDFVCSFEAKCDRSAAVLFDDKMMWRNASGTLHSL